MQDADLEDDRDETDVEESDADGFVVPNGYVSEDEGVRSVQNELDHLCDDLDGEPHAPLPLQPQTSRWALLLWTRFLSCAENQVSAGNDALQTYDARHVCCAISSR